MNLWNSILGASSGLMAKRRIPNPLPFTVLEMVLVISIILVIAAFILPAVFKGKASSHEMVCTNNLRNVGLSLTAYEVDYGRYPIDDPLIGVLNSTGYLSSDQEWHCPMDRSKNGDTYSYGYLGGHPATIRLDDPLVVCGWHTRVGALAVFPDGSVAPLSRRAGKTTLPVTVVYEGDTAEPGFILHQSQPLKIASPDGEEALVYGKNGAWFISASYDPYANNGEGMFSLVAGFNLSNNGLQEVSGDSEIPIQLYTKLQYCTVEAMSDPSANKATKLNWVPTGDKIAITLTDYASHRLTHRYTGDYKESEIFGSMAKFDATESSLQKK